MTRYAGLGDIHGNLPALEAVDKDMSTQAIDAVLILGDTASYGPHPIESTQKARDMSDRQRPHRRSVKGNHDHALTSTDKDRFKSLNFFAQASLLWIEPKFSGEYACLREHLRQLQLVRQEEEILMAHANFTNAIGWGYVRDFDDAKPQLEAITESDCLTGFITHTHLPMFYTPSLGEVYGQGQHIIEWKEPLLVNVGSVGNPRDGNTAACYVIYDTGSKTKPRTLTFRRVPYNVKKTAIDLRNSDIDIFMRDTYPKLMWEFDEALKLPIVGDDHGGEKTIAGILAWMIEHAQG